MIRQKFVLFFLFVAFTIGVKAQQSGIIRGRVLDIDNLSMPGANLVIESINKGTVTDNYGYFTLNGIPEGTYELSVSYIGFRPDKKQVTVEAGRTVVIDFTLLPGIELSEVVVSGQLQGQAKALNTQMNRGNITNIISSDQVGRFPDANIGDALKRIPGINVQYDQGEARFGAIRGTEARLNSVMINGERIPSAEGSNRVIQLDLIPADMIQMIEVNKTLTPDMDADAIGGSVNLVTRSRPAGMRFSATGASGYNVLAQKPIWTGALLFSNRFMDDRLGFNVSASIHDHQFGSDNIETEWEEDDNGNLYASDFQVRQYYLQRLRQSYSAGLDYKLDQNNTIFLNAMYNHRNDWENRYRLRYRIRQSDDDWTAEIRRDNKMRNVSDKNGARLEDQRTQHFLLGGDHLFGLRLKTDWSVSYSKAKEEKPGEMSIGYRVRNVAITPDFSNTQAPVVNVIETPFRDIGSEWSLFDLAGNDNFTTDRDITARLDFLLPLITEGNNRNSLKFGGRLRMKDKIRDNVEYEWEPLDEDGFDAMALGNIIGVSKENFLAGNYTAGGFIDPAWAGGIDYDNPSQFEKEFDITGYYPDNYTATENIYAGYLMLNQNLGDNLFLIAGVRLENTSISYEGWEVDEDEETVSPTSGIDNYLNILPALLVKYNIKSNTILRAAYTNSLARPNYYDLVPYRSISREDSELSEGNPDLNPTTSMNLDLMLEHYMRNVGLLSAGVFYKDINDFIFEYETRDHFDPVSGTTFDIYNTPLNGGNASILGVEFAAQHQMDYLPGFLSGLGIYANYTLTNSKIEGLPVEGRENEEMALPGTARNTLNSSLSYEKGNLSLRFSLNYSTSFLEADGVGASSFYDRFHDDALYVDANGSFKFSSNIRMFFEANNLTNQPLRFYQGSRGRVMQAEYYNMRFQFGLKIDL
jgi:TonB-dependent receptor